MNLALVALTVLCLLIAANAFMVRVAADSIGCPFPSAIRALVVSLVFALFGIASIVLFAFLARSGTAFPVLSIGTLVIGFVFAALIVKLGMRASWKQSLIVLALLICVSGAVVSPVLTAAPLFYRGYKIPTNGMAPSIRGEHYRGKCPQCAREMVFGVDRNFYGSTAPREIGICSGCFQIGPSNVKTNGPFSGDRVAVRKGIIPKRWDCLVFRFPGNPRETYVMRLIGLPGESIEIVNGRVLINGEQIKPPAEIETVLWNEDQSAMTFPLEQTYGIRGNQCDLSDDEYFVLGDFSVTSYDSRYWGPVPKENAIGTVSAIYWPPDRWGVLPSHE